jgi:hypothetical protein
MAIWNILRQFGIFYVRPFVNVDVIWYTFSRFGIMCLEKSGNPGRMQTNIRAYCKNVFALKGGFDFTKHAR